MSAVTTSALNPQGASVRQSSRQTRTNPSRTSKTTGRSSFGFGRGSNAESPATPPVPHGFYPALTHFTDAITALPREFRRHNSLLKEVDAKAWALEENLLQLLKYSSESQPVPHPPIPTPIVGGVAREDFLPKVCKPELDTKFINTAGFVLTTLLPSGRFSASRDARKPKPSTSL